MSERLYVLDPQDGRTVRLATSLYEWAARLGEGADDAWRVGWTELPGTGGPVVVSTRFLGVHHGPPGEEPVRVFETAVRGRAGEWQTWRYYASWTEAEAGHLAMVQLLTPPPED